MVTRARRVGILSDTHGRLDPGVLAWLEGCDLIVHAGDVGAAAVLDALAATGAEVRAVRGNNDVPAKWPPPHERLHALPTEDRIALPGGELVVVHGDHVLPATRRHERLRQRYPDARLIVYGHSHRLVIDREARPWVVNPGAAGTSRTYGGASACLLIAAERAWRVMARRFEPAQVAAADRQRARQLSIVSLFGKIDIDVDHQE
jgi:putative phosphoesterase